MTLLVVYLLFALGGSFLCSLLEAAILSLPPSYVAMLAEKNQRGGKRLQQLKDNIDRPLAAILTLNTFAHTLGAAGVGAQAIVVFGEAWAAPIAVVLTLMILFLSEIIPKTLGAVYAKQLAAFTAWSITILVYGLWPLVIMSEWLSRIITRGKTMKAASREEILSMIKMGGSGGHLSEHELVSVSNALRLRDVKVKDVMTPRTVVFALPEDMTVAESVEQEQPSHFTRIPLHQGDLDKMTSLVHRHSVLMAYAAGDRDIPLSQIAAPLKVIPEFASVSDALAKFTQGRQHLFRVIDEYGGTSGILTFEDTIETLLGREIMDETDRAADMQEVARRRAKILSKQSQEQEQDQAAINAPHTVDTDVSHKPNTAEDT